MTWSTERGVMKTYLAGTAMTTFGRNPDTDTVEMAARAGLAALEDAGLQPGDIDTLYLGNFLGQSLHHQGVLASLVARRLGLPLVPATAVEEPAPQPVSRCGTPSCPAGQATRALRSRSAPSS